MNIEVLYFGGCPNHEPTVRAVEGVARAMGVTDEIREVELTLDDDPAAARFLGSPTVLVDGVDIDPAQRPPHNPAYGFGCRTYDGRGVPSAAMVEAALRDATGYPRRGTRRGQWSVLAAIGAAIVSSACCWLPLGAMAMGLSAAGVAGYFEAARPTFVAVAIAFLAAGFYFAYFRVAGCAPVGACAAASPKHRRFNRAMLWGAAAIVTAFALFPYYGPPVIRAFTQSSRASLDPTPTDAGDVHAYRIDGMTCPACAAALEVRLSQLPGVAEAHVDYATATVELRISTSDFEVDHALNAIRDAGFTATPTP